MLFVNNLFKNKRKCKIFLLVRVLVICAICILCIIAINYKLSHGQSRLGKSIYLNKPEGLIEENELSQQEIDDAIISFWATDGISLVKSTTTKEEFLFMDGHGLVHINSTTHGDINGDGLKDVIVATTWCAASCGNPIIVIINQKDTYDGNNFPQKYSVFKADFPGIEDAGYARPEIIDVNIVHQLAQVKIKDESEVKEYYYRLSSTNGAARYIFTKCESVSDETGECRMSI